MELFQLYQDSIAALNTQQGGHLRPERNFNSWVNEISFNRFRMGCEQWQTSKMLSEDMRPFYKTVNITVQHPAGKSFGLFLLPEGVEYVCAVRVLVRNDKTFAMPGVDMIDGKTGKACNDYQDPDEAALAKVDTDFIERTVNEVDTQRWGAALEHRGKKPTMKKPIYTVFEGGMKIAPQDVAIVVVDYFRLPVKAVFDYTLGTDDQILFNPTTSVDPEWSETLKEYFLKEISTRYSKFTRDTDLFQMSKAQ